MVAQARARAGGGSRSARESGGEAAELPLALRASERSREREGGECREFVCLGLGFELEELWDFDSMEREREMSLSLRLEMGYGLWAACIGPHILARIYWPIGLHRCLTSA